MKKIIDKFKNAKNKKALIMLILGAVLFVSGTLAYYTASTEFDNLFAAASFGSNVQESFVSPNNWTPGDTTPKTLTVTNEGDINLKARVKITESWVGSGGTSLPLSLGNNLGNAAIINFHANSGWTKMSCGSPAVTYYVYDEVLEPEDTSVTLIDSVTYNPNVVGTYSCRTTETNGVTTQRCQTGEGYNGGTYTLRFDIDTIQSDAYTSWNCTAYQEEQPAPEGKYKVIFNGDGATGGSMSDLLCDVGVNCTLTANTYTRTNYTFQGWATTSGGTVVYDDEDTVIDLALSTQNVDLYAVWQANNTPVEPVTDPEPVTPLTGTVHYHGDTHYVTLTQASIWSTENEQTPNCNGCSWKANYDLSVASSDGTDLDGYAFRIGLNSGVTGYECNGGTVTTIDSDTLLFTPYANQGTGESPITKETVCQFWYTAKNGYVTIEDDNTGASAQPVQTITGNVTYKNAPLTVTLDYVEHSTVNASNCGGTDPCYQIKYTYDVENTSSNTNVTGFSFYLMLNSNVVGVQGYGLTADVGDGTYYRMHNDYTVINAGNSVSGTSTGDFVVYSKAINSTFTIATDPDNEYDQTLYYTKTINYSGTQLKIELTKVNGWSTGSAYVGQYAVKVTNVGTASVNDWAFDLMYTSKFTNATASGFQDNSYAITGGLRVMPNDTSDGPYDPDDVIINTNNNMALQLTFTDSTGVPNIGD